MSKLHTSRFLFPKVNQILISSLVFCLSAPYAQTGWSIIQSPAACHVGTAEYSLKNCCAQDPMDSMCTESLNKVLNEWSKLDGAPTATNDEWCNAAQVYSNMVISQHGRDIKESIKKFIREQGGKAALRFNQATHCKEYDAQLIQNLQKAKKLLENSGFTH